MMEKKQWQKWLQGRWYEALVILIVGGILLYVWGYVNSGSIDGILVKTDSGTMYLLNLQDTYDDWGTIVLQPQAKETMDLTKWNTGDRVKLKGNISIAESSPVQYHNVKRILLDEKYDAESVQIVKEAVQCLGHELWHGKVIYSE